MRSKNLCEVKILFQSTNFISKYKCARAAVHKSFTFVKIPKPTPGPHPEPSPAGAKKNFFYFAKIP